MLSVEWLRRGGEEVVLGRWGADKERRTCEKKWRKKHHAARGGEERTSSAVEENGEMSAATFQGYTPSALSFPRAHSACVRGNHYPSSTE